MQYNAVALQRLVESFERMPGIGRKTAQRIAFYIVGLPGDEGKVIADNIRDACEKIHYCAVCCDLTDEKVCRICANDRRDKSIVCVVEDPQSLLAVEKTGEYRGLYHVLHGSISPLEGRGPDDLTIKQLLARLQTGEIREVILATDSDVEGDATAMYLTRLIKPLGVKTTRLAFGVPMGTDIQYADEITLGKAISGRLDV